jgi:hypothetical protein
VIGYGISERCNGNHPKTNTVEQTKQTIRKKEILNLKRHLLNFAPWVLLLAIGTIATPRYANTAPPAEPHPHIRAAISELREARNELQHAAHDFCGHRVDAMRDTQVALNQLQKALECDHK